ncbi:SAF domain-containing protein [Candidatus Poriferisocius sp.]|uniref:SAF domain-containing protein n=1 Tax=Candidatus Poriferisocius sp. TaxID=3101276 RepID=UPI003B5A8276
MRMASEDRRRQLPWVALGLTVTLTAAIIFALWASSLSSRTEVAVAARDISSGSTVEIEDLRAVEVASGQGAGFVPMADLEFVVGRTVRTSIPEGAIFHPGMLSTNSLIDRGAAVVGAVLQPGEYPIAHLSPGQPVGVVITSHSDQPNAVDRIDRVKRTASPDTLDAAIQATVAEVSEIRESGRQALFLSLLASADDAVVISKAAASNELRLILLPNKSQEASRGEQRDDSQEASQGERRDDSQEASQVAGGLARSHQVVAGTGP